MENASKTLIIAGAILISILLISVGVLLFNSSSGVADNTGETGDVMASAAADEKVKIILSTIDIENDEVFNNYIKSKYANRKLTAGEVVEMCELIRERTFRISGNAKHTHEETHITCDPSAAVYQNASGDIVYSNLKNNKQYVISYYGYDTNSNILSVSIVEK